MMLIRWFAHNPVAANLLMLLIIAGGLLSLPSAEQYVYPPEPRDQLEIQVRYPGAGPAEVEQSLCIPIEEAVYDLEGVINLDSTARQEVCRIALKFDPDIGLLRMQAAVKTRLDALTTLPEEAERLQIRELLTGVPAAIVAIYGDADLLTLMQLRNRLQAELSKRREIGQTRLYPERPFELSIEIAEEQLRRYGLSFGEIAEAIQNSSQNIPAGEISNTNGKVLLRSKGQALSASDYAAIELRSHHDGKRLLLGDIADIRQTAGEQDWRVRMDGKPTVEIIVQPHRQVTATVNAVNEVIEEFRGELPPGIEITTWDDWSKYYRMRMTMLAGNLFSAFALVFLVLVLFLQLQLALWVSVGIIVSFLGALSLLTPLGISLNTYSITAFILVLGIVVDDTIVIGENIYSHQRRHRSSLKAAVAGTQEVATLVILMVLSTVIAFTPGFFLPGLSGRLMSNVSAVVILALLFSLLEALFILPAHLTHLDRHISPSSLAILQRRVDASLHWFIQRLYLPLLQFLLRYRYPSLSAFVVLLMVAIALVISGRVPSVMQPPVNDYYLVARLNFPPGAAFETVHSQVLRLEDKARQIRRELNADKPLTASDSVRHIFSITYDNWALVDMEMSTDERVRGQMDDIKRRWQELFGEVPAGATLSFQTFWPKELGIASAEAGKAIELQLTAPDPAQQSAAGAALQAALNNIPGVHSVSGSMQTGKPELRLKLKPAARYYGLTLKSLGEQVRHGFFGLEAQRYLRERDEIRVMLRYPASQRRSLDNLNTMPVRLPGGLSVPFAVVAEAEQAPGFAKIDRQDRRRTLVVGAEVYQDMANAEDVLTKLQAGLIPELERRYPGLAIEPGRARQEQGQAMSALWRYGALALLAIYTLLAVPLCSYLQPLIIMLVIPFGFVGVVLGHLLLGLSLTLESYVALFAVAGVVVNDSLVLAAFINKERKNHDDLYRVLMQAGQLRFRPIILTTLTTFIGLIPIMSEQGPDAEQIIPMATTLAFGVLFSTLVTLLLVPISYAVLNDLKKPRSVPSESVL